MRGGECVRMSALTEDTALSQLTRCKRKVFLRQQKPRLHKSGLSPKADITPG